MSDSRRRDQSAVDRLAAWDTYRAASEDSAEARKNQRWASHQAATAKDVHSPEDLPSGVRMSRDRDGKVVYEFKRPRSVGPLVGVLFLLAALVAIPATLEAMSTRDPVDIGIALSLVAVALICWAAMLSSDRRRLRVVGGAVEVTDRGALHRFDLTNRELKVHPFGTVDSREWRIGLERPGQPLFYVDRHLVSPKAFDHVLRRYRSGAGQRRSS